MKTKAMQLVTLLLVGALASSGWAQDKPKTEEKPKSETQTTPAKAQIVFTEYDGDKKVKSLPYTLYMNAPDAPDLRPGTWAKLRIGSRVPVYTGGTGNMTYVDVGTNIDARAAYTGDGHFLLYLNLERSWVEGDVVVPIAKNLAPQEDASDAHFKEPIIRQFKSELDFIKIREGQVVESTMATDPLSGRVLKVEVSVTSVK